MTFSKIKFHMHGWRNSSVFCSKLSSELRETYSHHFHTSLAFPYRIWKEEIGGESKMFAFEIFKKKKVISTLSSLCLGEIFIPILLVRGHGPVKTASQKHWIGQFWNCHSTIVSAHELNGLINVKELKQYLANCSQVL